MTGLIITFFTLLVVLGSFLLLFPNEKNVVNIVLNTNPMCNDNLWQHVYNPERLEIINPCITVEGVIKVVRKEADGDLHILLDVQNKSLLNDKNIKNQKGFLVLEPVCVNEVKQEDAKESCEGFVNNISIPIVGDNVLVTGSYVLDKSHGWMEIHPVTNFKKWEVDR